MKRHAGIVVIFAALTGVSGAASAAAQTLASANPRMTSAAAPARHTRVPAADPLLLDVYPRVMAEGGQARVRLRIEPNELSRGVEISWWSKDGIGGSHFVEVDGDRAFTRYEF